MAWWSQQGSVRSGSELDFLRAEVGVSPAPSAPTYSALRSAEGQALHLTSTGDLIQQGGP